MEAAELQDIVTQTALALPAAAEGQPFGEGAWAYKVVGRMFALRVERPESSIVNLKCAPRHGAALVAEYDEITPGWHMNKRHWITLSPGPRLVATLVEDLVGNSYDLVVAGLPRDRRPLDPLRGGDL